MTIVNIRGTSGSGKSTLVHRFLQEYEHSEIWLRLGDWKNPKIVGYRVFYPEPSRTFVIGRYSTQCGGCDALSYKGSHTDIENMIREYSEYGNVIFEGLTISSTITRWLNISQDNPGKFIWAFMDTPEDECYRRILARSGREPKRDHKGMADYNRKYRGCLVQKAKLETLGEHVIDLSSDDIGYKDLVNALT